MKCLSSLKWTKYCYFSAFLEFPTVADKVVYNNLDLCVLLDLNILYFLFPQDSWSAYDIQYTAL